MKLLLFSIITLSSCITDKSMDLREFKNQPLIGMIYDMNNEPVPYAKIQLNNREEENISDINGRFMVYEVNSGIHTLSLIKVGFEPLSTTIEYYDKAQVVYLKMTSYDQLLQSIEDSLAKREYKLVQNEIDRAKSIKQDEAVLKYLDAVYHFLINDYDYSIRILQQLQIEGYRTKAINDLLLKIHDSSD